jgi:hypothetical protein
MAVLAFLRTKQEQKRKKKLSPLIKEKAFQPTSVLIFGIPVLSLI